MTTHWHEMSALSLGTKISQQEINPVDLCEYFLDRIEKMNSDNDIYLRTTARRAIAEASAASKRAKRGLRLSPLDGVPISWKDLFDTSGDVTSHGSKVLKNRIASQDATVVARATLAGLVCLGKTNQTEFAFSILGINPNYGTPPNPFDKKVPRLPGGSTSGGAISVSKGLAAAAIGSDTGGSVRVPAAWNGLVGLKTSFGILPLNGVLGLSTTLDTVGPLTKDVSDASAMYTALSGRFGEGNGHGPDLNGLNPRNIKLILPSNLVWKNLDKGVQKTTESAIESLKFAGVHIHKLKIPEFDEVETLIAHFGPYHASECHALWHQDIESAPELVYSPILERIRLGGEMSASKVEVTKQKLKYLSQNLHGRLKRFGMIAMPTVAISPPSINALEQSMDEWQKANVLSLRNTRLFNFLDCAALTLPCGIDNNNIPVGLMIVAPSGSEEHLLRVGKALEPILIK